MNNWYQDTKWRKRTLKKVGKIILKLENPTLENRDKSIVINLLISKGFTKVLQTWFNDLTWILKSNLALPGGAEFSLVEKTLDQTKDYRHPERK